MATRHVFNTLITTVNLPVLRQAIINAGYSQCEVANLLSLAQIGVDLELTTLTPAQQTQIQSIIDTHDSTDYAGLQVANAQASLSAILNNNFNQLNAEDAAYALMGRAMARKDGATQATIDGIVDRATAAAYLTNKVEWINLPAAAKAWLADELDMIAVMFQIAIIILRR